MASYRPAAPFLLALCVPWSSEALKGKRTWSPTEPEASQKALESIPPARLCSARETKMRELEETFRKDYATRVSEPFAAMQTSAVLTLCGFAPKPLANYLLHWQRVAVAEKRSFTLASALADSYSLNSCKTLGKNLAAHLRVVCIDMVGWIPTNLEDGQTFMYWWSKPVIFETAVRSSPHGVLMTDLDVVVYQDLLSYAESVLSEHESTLMVAACEYRKWWYNTGTVFASKRSLPLMQLWLQENNCYYGSSAGDQSALNSVFQRNLSQIGASTMQLWMMPQALVGQLCVKGTHATHYNCMMKTAKGLQAVMEDQGDWEDVDGVLTDGWVDAQRERSSSDGSA